MWKTFSRIKVSYFFTDPLLWLSCFVSIWPLLTYRPRWNNAEVTTLFQRQTGTLKIPRRILFHLQRRINVISTLIHNRKSFSSHDVSVLLMNIDLLLWVINVTMNIFYYHEWKTSLWIYFVIIIFYFNVFYFLFWRKNAINCQTQPYFTVHFRKYFVSKQSFQ